jgi:transcriptional regulator with XRE-family HTH domain
MKTIDDLPEGFTFGEYMDKIMELEGINQSELARRIDVQPSHVSHLKSGNRNLTIDMVVKIATATHRPPEEVFRAATRLHVKVEQLQIVEQVKYISLDLPEDEQISILEYALFRKKLIDEKGKHNAKSKNRKNDNSRRTSTNNPGA